MQKNIRINANTWQHLNDSTISPTGASHKHLHINPNEKKREKESRLPCCASISQHDRLAPLVPRKHVRLSCLAPLVHVRFPTRLLPRAPRQHVFSAHSQTPHFSLRALSPHERPSARPLPRAPRPLLSELCLSSNSLSCGLLKLSTHERPSARPLRTAPRSLLGALHPSPPIGRTCHPSPLPFHASETGR